MTDHEIDPRAAHDLHETGAAILLDVREPEEWEAGHAPGALHIPLGQLDPDRVQGDGRVVAICRSGHRSGQAARLLAASGVDAVNMSGGMQAWSADGLPVVTPDGGSGTVA